MVCLQSLLSVGVVTIFIVVFLCPFMSSVLLVLFCMLFVLFFFWPVACFIVCILVLSSLCHLFFTYNITWFGVWLFFVFDITWCMCYGDYGISFGGGSYSSVYVPPPMFVFPMILIICIPSLFFVFSLSLYFVFLFIGTHYP